MLVWHCVMPNLAPDSIRRGRALYRRSSFQENTALQHLRDHFQSRERQDPVPSVDVSVARGAYENSDGIDRFRMFAEALPCIVWIADSNGSVKWCSRKFYSYTGLSADTQTTMDWSQYVHTDDQLSLAQDVARCLASGIELDSIARIRNASGIYRWFSVRASCFHDDTSMWHWFGTLTDIQERQVLLDANTHIVNALMKGYLSKPLPHLRDVTFDAHYRAANVMERLGGDWYEVFGLPDGRTAFSLGDVCGHGVEAAVKMRETKQAISAAACLGDPAPLAVLTKANDMLFLNNHRVSLATAIYGIVNSELKTITYASAGHHPPILARANGETVILPNHGFPLGVEEHMPPRIKTHDIDYESGSTMVLYTDGLIEFSHDLVDGENRLLAAASESVRVEPEHPATFIAERVLDGAQAKDDVAVLTLSFH